MTPLLPIRQVPDRCTRVLAATASCLWNVLLQLHPAYCCCIDRWTQGGGPSKPTELHCVDAEHRHRIHLCYADNLTHSGHVSSTCKLGQVEAEHGPSFVSPYVATAVLQKPSDSDYDPDTEAACGHLAHTAVQGIPSVECQTVAHLRTDLWLNISNFRARVSRRRPSTFTRQRFVTFISPRKCHVIQWLLSRL